MDWRSRFNAELLKAEQAHLRGNEGQARVCARRAAGMAAREYLILQGIRPEGGSAMVVLLQLGRDPRLPEHLLHSIHHLSRQVDQDFRLPPGVDLISEASRLCDGLMGPPVPRTGGSQGTA
jgi:hypothetical protein